MKRLPRLFDRPWAYVAGGSLSLLGIAGLTQLSGSLGGLGLRTAANDSAEVNWVADPSQYPPALLRVPERITPAELNFASPRAIEQGRSLQRPPAMRRTNYSEGDTPVPEQRSVLKRLPVVEPPVTGENGGLAGRQPLERIPAVEASSPAGTIVRLPPPATESAYNPGWESLSTDLGKNNLDPPPAAADPSPFAPPIKGATSPSEPDAGSSYPAVTPEDFRPRVPGIEPLPNCESAAPRLPAVQPAPEPEPLISNSGSSTAMQAVADRASELSRHGFSLADRGAYYSARAEFVQTLRLITQALDAQRGDARHSQALAQGLRALEEADDFVPKGTQLEADLNMAAVIVAHQTPVLKNSAAQASPLAAVQRYYTFAQEQLAIAGGNQPVASAALFGLGKIHLALAKESADARRLGGPKAMTLHQAALLVDARNYRAANELGVLLARYGQLDDAKRVLLVGLATARQSEAWHNLAVVHERLGETDLARRARYEEQVLAANPEGGPTSEALVRWVDTKEFSAAGHGVDTAAPPTTPGGAPAASTTATAPAPLKKSSGFWFWK